MQTVLSALATLVISLALAGCTCCDKSKADTARKAPAGAHSLAFDVHNGYFVSNQFEPDAPASFVVLQDSVAFDKVFGTAYVMQDKSHRLPKDAFATKFVIAAIKRGKATWNYKVDDVKAEGKTLLLRYSAKPTPSETATFSSPLIVSVPRGDYAAVRFIENGTPAADVPVKSR